jgi:hypothetical protein
MYRAAFLLAGLTFLAAPAAAETLDRTVKANAPSAIGGFFGYEVDTCYQSVIPDVKVKQAPANGTFQIVPYEHTVREGSRCAGRKVRGLAYVYTPKKGFTGSDEVVLDVPWSSNDLNAPTLWTYTYRIKIQ